MTDDDLREIEERRANITPTPWTVEPSIIGHPTILHPNSVNSTVAKVYCDFDAAFIASAPTDIDRLLAEVRRLKRLYEPATDIKGDKSTGIPMTGNVQLPWDLEGDPSNLEKGPTQ